MPFSYSIVDSLKDVPPQDWDALVGADNPFVEYAFLAALEDTGCTGLARTGWLPRHVLFTQGGPLVAALPLYEKHDSYGEYIFDWGWAHASHQAGIPYYPKLTAAVPFTPTTGPRLLGASNTVQDPAFLKGLRQAVDDVAVQIQASSVHVLFSMPEEQTYWDAMGFQSRHSYQFHWQKQPSWHTFADFLASMRAPVRKQIRKERQRAHSHGLDITLRPGKELTPADWQAMRRFYESTIRHKGAIAYLTLGFFESLPSRLAHRMLVAMAHRGSKAVAGAMFFFKGSNLYGRYWGCDEHFEGLHFELCYYLPIEWCLAHGMQRFEAGAQGEHKLKRGFLPALCHSNHEVYHPGLRRAVAEFLQDEKQRVSAYLQILKGHSPFKRSD